MRRSGDARAGTRGGLYGFAAVTAMVVIVAVVAVLHARTVRPVAVGQKAPAFTLPELSGRSFTLTAPLREPVILDFFTTWCPPCQSEAPTLARFAARFRGRVRLILIDRREGPPLAATFVRNYGLSSATILLDRNDKLAAPFGVTGQPETFGIDKRGMVRFHVVGPMTANELDARAQALLR